MVVIGAYFWLFFVSRDGLAAAVKPQTAMLFVKEGGSDTTKGKFGKDTVHALPDTVVVTAARVPQGLSEVTRSFTILSAEEVRNLPAISDALETVPAVDVKSRGPFGVQADVGIRGSSFKQVLFLVDGLRMNDPQTAHHNLDLPLSLLDLERVEVVRGAASSLYGHDACGGVINFITREPGAKPSPRFRLSFGDHNTRTGAAAFDYRWGRLGLFTSLERKTSDGYRSNTDFDLWSGFSKLVLELGRSRLTGFYGYGDKDFGAQGFYTAARGQERPEREWTTTRFFGLSWQGQLGPEAGLRATLYRRRHEDTYVLDYTRPGFYRNYHKTHISVAELQAELGPWVVGGELAEEDIASIRLGDHRLRRGAIYAERFLELGRLTLVPGLRWNGHTEFASRLSPSLGFRQQVSPSLDLRGFAGGAFRAPNYTERYYTDPGHRGNPDLSPERTRGAELGLDYQTGRISWAATGFWCQGYDLIDWEWDPDDSVWTTQNIGQDRVVGLEQELRFKLPRRATFWVGYTYMEAKDRQTYKYLSGRPRHLFSSGVGWTVLGLQVKLEGIYKNRYGQEDYFLLNGGISRELRLPFFRGRIFLQGTNLLGESYREYRIPMPGRWVQVGTEFDLFKAE